MKLFFTNGNVFRKIYPILFWLLMWQLSAMLINRQLFVPSPYSTLKALYLLIIDSDFWMIITMSIYRVLMGFIIAVIVGCITGILSGINQVTYQLLHPLIVAIKSTPVLSFIIIALLWFGSSNVPIFICFLMCYPLIWTSVVEGIRQVDKQLLQMADTYEVKRKYIIRDIYIPTIFPYLITGVLSGLGLGWKVTVAAEVLSHPRYAIGAKLHDAKIYLESDRLFAWTIVVIALSMFFELLIEAIIRKLSGKGTYRLIKKGEHND